MPANSVIREQFSHMGSHSGYDCLFSEINKVCKLNSIYKKENHIKIPFQYKIFNLIRSKFKYTRYYTPNSLFAELEIALQTILKNIELIHVAYLENNYGFLQLITNTKIIATAHQPTSWWKYYAQDPSIVNQLDGLIVLGKKEKKFFSNFLSEKKIHFIPHGVDTNFFTPKQKLRRTANPIKCTFSGSWLRDINTLVQVIKILSLKSSNKYQFNIIYPLEKRQNSVLHNLLSFNNISWYSDISDKELAQIYNSSDIFILPLLDCTANNALLEAMSSALPIIVTELPNIKDYTNNSFTHYIPPYDIDKFIEKVELLAANPILRAERGKKAREYALKYDWKNIANETLIFYKNIIES